MTVTDPGVLSGNLLSYADSSFETGSTSWVASYASTIDVGVSSAKAFAGSKSLTFSVNANGSAQVQLGPIACAPGEPYVFSAYLNVPAARQVIMYVVWSDSTQSDGPYRASTGAGWLPLYGSGYAPADATSFTLNVYVGDAVSGDVYYLDEAYVARSDLQILVDWVNPPLMANAVAGNAFSDITPWVRNDQATNITRGRQDSISAVQPGKATFTVENNAGWFTPAKQTSPWFPGVKLGRRIQVNVCDETGVWNTRFDGQIASFSASPVVTGQQNLVQVSCADVLAFLNRQPELSCWTVELAKFYGPVLQYVMNEAPGAPGLADSTGNGPVLEPFKFGSVPYPPALVSGGEGTVTYSYEYQSGNSPVEGAVAPTTYNGASALNTSQVTSPLPSVYFGATISASTSNLAVTAGSQNFYGPLPESIVANSGAAYTVVCWVWPDITTANWAGLAYGITAFCLGSSKTGRTLSMCFAENTYYVQHYANFLTASTSITNQEAIALSTQEYSGPVMLAMTISGQTVTAHVGGNLYGVGDTVVNSSSFNLPANVAFDWLNIGGMLSGGYGWIGNISNFCVYDYVLNASQLNDLASHGAEGTRSYSNTGSALGELVGYFTDLINVDANYWTVNWDNGSSTLDYYDITGQNVLSALQQLELVEKGVYYVDAHGNVQLRGRARRMGAQAPIAPSNITMTEIGWTLTSGTSATVNVGATNYAPAGNSILIIVTVPAAATVTISGYSQVGSATGPDGQVTYVFASLNLTYPFYSSSITVTQSVSQEIEATAYTIPNVYAVDSVSASSGTSTAPSVSTGVQSGYYDFEIAIFANNSNVGTTSVPSGWTHVEHNFGEGNLQSDVFTKCATPGFGNNDTCTSAYASSTAWCGIGIALMAVTDVLPAGSYDASIAPKWNDQYLVNTEVFQNEARGGTVSVSVNQQSADDYGTYPNGSVQSPQTAPIPVWATNITLRQIQNPGTSITQGVFSSANMQDAGDWDVNTQGEPGMKLATVKVDVLSNLPGGAEYVPVSNLYQHDVGDLIELSEALPWWPDQPNASILFIEGVTETYSTLEKSVTYYTSPAIQGVAWQPGSALSGTLDETAVVGISNVTSPDTDSVPVPSFSPTMNIAEGANGYVGAHDLRGLTQNLQNMLQPPLVFMWQRATPQTLPSGTATQLLWDATIIDTVQGAQPQTGSNIIALQGWYEVYLTVSLNHATSANVTCWIAQNQNGAVRKIAPVSQAHNNGTSEQSALTTSAVFYCYPGDAIGAFVLQDSGSSIGTSTSNGGSHMSIRYLGNGNGRN